jgi:hypothetical protein
MGRENELLDGGEYIGKDNLETVATTLAGILDHVLRELSDFPLHLKTKNYSTCSNPKLGPFRNKYRGFRVTQNSLKVECCNNVGDQALVKYLISPYPVRTLLLHSCKRMI